MTERRQRGFTLVEVLVSLAILAVALAVLLGAISASLDRTRKNRDEALAISLVQSLIAKAQTRPTLSAGRTDGAYSNGYRWQLDVTRLGNAADWKAWQTGALRITATVTWQEGSTVQSRSLAAIRIVPVARS